MNDALIAALKAEREGYVVRGLPDRVAEVDAELKRLGVSVESRAKAPAKERAVKPKTETR